MQDAAEARHRARVILWLVMALSILAYYIVVQLAPPQSAQANQVLVTVLLVVAVSVVAVSFVVKSVFVAQASAEDRPARKHAAYITALAMCESAAVLGVVVWFLTGSRVYYVFLLLGLAGLLLHFPKRDEGA